MLKVCQGVRKKACKAERRPAKQGTLAKESEGQQRGKRKEQGEENSGFVVLGGEWRIYMWRVAVARTIAISSSSSRS